MTRWGHRFVREDDVVLDAGTARFLWEEMDDKFTALQTEDEKDGDSVFYMMQVRNAIAALGYDTEVQDAEIVRVATDQFNDELDCVDDDVLGRLDALLKLIAKCNGLDYDMTYVVLDMKREDKRRQMLMKGGPNA